MKTARMNSPLLIAVFGLLTLFWGLQSTPQTYQKHPRAMELERQMTKDALDFLKSRFPDYPVIVTVSIDPIYRKEARENNRHERNQDDSLPFFRPDEDEIVDEWDDPSLPNSVLLSRVKKIVVNVSVPGHLTDDEVAEIKQSLTLNLNLLPARDSIDITKRSWGQKKEPEFNPMTYIWTFLGGLFLFFVALLIAIWTPMRQIARILKEGVAATKNNSGNNSPSVIMPVSSKSNESSGHQSSSPSTLGAGPQGDVRFSDPIKLQTAISLFFTTLSKTENFPSLEDMIFLDDICKSNPSLIGAFLLEAPQNLREKIFSYSSGQHWLEAMHNPGPVDIRVYETVHKLNRMTRAPKQSPLELMMIAVWRLGDQMGPFLRSFPQAEAFSILYRLPKSLSLTVARAIWPGSWALLLEIDYKTKELTSDFILNTSNSALNTLPFRSMDALSQFRQDMDLMNFLGTVDPSAEREIYLAAPSTSLLHKLRPPFYLLFEAEEKVLKMVIDSVSLKDLALALVNIPLKDRKIIEGHLSEKQKIRFSEYLKQFEMVGENTALIVSQRSQIAHQLRDFIQQDQQINSKIAEQGKPNENNQKSAA